MNIKVYQKIKLLTLIPSLMMLFTLNISGQVGTHDPTQLVQDGGQYWTFNTGNGIGYATSENTNFSGFTGGRIFPQGSVPEWINNYVPGFEEHFWAPGIIFMDGEWHVYYSCSTFGSQTSAIGLVTTPSIADSAWEDQGMAVYSNPNRGNELGYQVNAIDADVMRDKEGRVWLLYGSYWDGIVMTELDTVTGKPIDDTDLHHVANGNPEAGYVMWHGDYYYLFFNRGRCCAGTNSTYRMLMGRSKNPTGPFYDRDSVATHQGGGSLFLHTDGRFLAPGHFGYGEGKLTYHYYDGQVSGWSRLGIGTIRWEEDSWPVAEYARSYAIANGTYVLTNDNSDKVLDLEGGSTATGTNVIQNSLAEDSSKFWTFTHVGQGYYKISPSQAPDKALEIASCSFSNRGNAQIGDYDSLDCQLWYVGRMNSLGEYRIVSKNSYRVLEIDGGSTDDGANVHQWSYSENQRDRQSWTFEEPDDIEFPTPSSIQDANNNLVNVNIYPNPTSNGNFTIELDGIYTNQSIVLEIYSMDGKRLYNQEYMNISKIEFSKELDQGLYHVKMIIGNSAISKKLSVK